MTEVRRLPTEELTDRELSALRALFDASWPEPDDRFEVEDFRHALGGVHFVVEVEGQIVAHASVVERELEVDEFRLATGYVEGVATLPEHRQRGYGSAVMLEAGDHIDATFELGALGSDLFDFYGRLGWTVWEGPTWVRTDDGPVRTTDEDGFVLVRLTPTSPELDLAAPISCEWRPGDVW